MSWRTVVIFGLVLGGACARLDVRELIPAQRLAVTGPARAQDVAVAMDLLGDLPGPPTLSGGLGSLLPQPLGDLAGSVPLLGGILALSQQPRWIQDARRGDVLSPRLVDGILGGPGVPLTGHRPGWALSDEASAMAAARDQGARWLLVVKASVGPEDGGEPLPRRLTAAADVALLDPHTAETRARAYDRVSVLVGGGRDGLPYALRRAGAELGRRLHKQLGLELDFPKPQAQMDSEGEEKDEDAFRR
jgi:hypothetical protein